MSTITHDTLCFFTGKTVNQRTERNNGSQQILVVDSRYLPFLVDIISSMRFGKPPKTVFLIGPLLTIYYYH